MSRTTHHADLHVITGWRLHDGSVVYLARQRTWVSELVEAAQWNPTELETELAFATEPSTGLEVVDAYSFPVGSEGPTGRRVRENIRAVGPTVRPDLQRKLS